MAAQHTQSVGYVTARFIDAAEGARLAMELLGLVHAAESESSLAAGLRGWVAAAPVFVFEQRQVRRHFARQTSLLPARPNDIQKPE
jgi:hypothetical protein